MRPFNYLFFVVIALFLGACGTQKYSTTKIESVNFNQYKTYGWVAPVDSLSKGYLSNDIDKSNIIHAANTSLESFGLTHSADAPDLLFRYIAIVNNKISPIYEHYYMPFRYYNPYYMTPRLMQVGEDYYRMAHIIVEARERDSKRLVWQARGSAKIKSPEKLSNNVSEMVNKIMANYPAAKK